MNAQDRLSVLLILDWDMNFLLRKFRESQTDWLAKCGISFHLNVVIRRGDDCQLQMKTFVNVFSSCSQDTITVLSVLSDVVRQLKEAHPRLTNFYYYRGATIVEARLVTQQHGVLVRRMDFCDSQAGKGRCDRRAATKRSHMKI